MYHIGTVSWKKIGGYFLQKISISSKGVLSYEYHYKIKSSKPSIVFEIDTAATREFAMLTSIEKDLRDSLRFLDEYQMILSYKQAEKNDILLKALFRAIVITYGRCFKNSNARIKILSDDVISEKNKDVHAELIEIRDKYVAHADDTEYESCRLVFVLSPEMKYRKSMEATFQPFMELKQGYPDEFSENFKSPIKDAHQWVKNKLESLQSIVYQPFKSEDLLEKLYKYAKNKTGRIILNEKKLNEICEPYARRIK